MINKTIKAAVAAFAILTGVQVHGFAGRDMTIAPQTCCVGNIAQACGCVLSGSGKARGNVILQQDAANLHAMPLNKLGTITIPQVGSKSLFSYMTANGEVKVLFASYNLENIDANKNLSGDMRAILNHAKAKNPEAVSLIWTGRSLKGQGYKFTELTETPTSEAELNAKVTYTTNPAAGTATFTLPVLKAEGKTIPSEVIKVDLGKIQ
jgi:hypothetical protein